MPNLNHDYLIDESFDDFDAEDYENLIAELVDKAERRKPLAD